MRKLLTITTSLCIMPLCLVACRPTNAVQTPEVHDATFEPASLSTRKSMNTPPRNAISRMGSDANLDEKLGAESNLWAKTDLDRAAPEAFETATFALG